jgi:hypothetical protein
MRSIPDPPPPWSQLQSPLATPDFPSPVHLLHLHCRGGRFTFNLAEKGGRVTPTGHATSTHRRVLNAAKHPETPRPGCPCLPWAVASALAPNRWQMKGQAKLPWQGQRMGRAAGWQGPTDGPSGTSSCEPGQGGIERKGAATCAIYPHPACHPSQPPCPLITNHRQHRAPCATTHTLPLPPTHLPGGPSSQGIPMDALRRFLDTFRPSSSSCNAAVASCRTLQRNF